MSVGMPTPPTPTPPQPPHPEPPPPPPPPPPPLPVVQDVQPANQDNEVEKAAGPTPDATNPRSDGVNLPNQTPQPEPGGTVRSFEPARNEPL